MKKFLGAKQSAAQATVDASAQSTEAGGAAMASSVAAIGIGIGMVTAAAASLMAVVSGMNAKEVAISIVALVLVVSLPSMILTWFKLRKRDLGAILNAGGWAVNRPMYFSMKRARAFTKCAPNPMWLSTLLSIALVAGIIWGLAAYQDYREKKACEAEAVSVEAK